MIDHLLYPVSVLIDGFPELEAVSLDDNLPSEPLHAWTTDWYLPADDLEPMPHPPEARSSGESSSRLACD